MMASDTKEIPKSQMISESYQNSPCLFLKGWYTPTPKIHPRSSIIPYKKMKIGVVSDTHLHSVTNGFKEIYNRYLAETDLILHAGDVVSSEVIDFLSKNNFRGVHGNMDPVDVKQRLPGKTVVELKQCRIGLMHGWGSSVGLEDRILPEFGKVDVIVYGHSHRPASFVKAGVLFFNPGTATGYSSSGIHSLGLLQVNETVDHEIIML